MRNEIVTRKWRASTSIELSDVAGFEGSCDVPVDPWWRSERVMWPLCMRNIDKNTLIRKGDKNSLRRKEDSPLRSEGVMWPLCMSVVDKNCLIRTTGKTRTLSQEKEARIDMMSTPHNE